MQRGICNYGKHHSDQKFQDFLRKMRLCKLVCNQSALMNKKSEQIITNHYLWNFINRYFKTKLVVKFIYLNFLGCRLGLKRILVDLMVCKLIPDPGPEMYLYVFVKFVTYRNQNSFISINALYFSKQTWQWTSQGFEWFKWSDIAGLHSAILCFEHIEIKHSPFIQS